MAVLRCKDSTTKINIISKYNIFRKMIIVLKKALTGGAPFCGVGALAVFGRWVSSRFLSAASNHVTEVYHCI